MISQNLQRAWFELYRDLANAKEPVAAPFFSVAPRKYNSQETNILYVGKATAGEWNENNNFQRRASSGLVGRITERRNQNRSFVESCAMSKKRSAPGFWSFAHQLSEVVNGGSCDLRNLVWTNLCKIGVLKENPSGEVLKRQRELAIDTLRAELRIYNPDLIVFVTANFGKDILLEALEFSNDDNLWKKSETHSRVKDVWWHDNHPHRGILWMRHPQGSPLDLRQYALKKAEKLTHAF